MSRQTFRDPYFGDGYPNYDSSRHPSNSSFSGSPPKKRQSRKRSKSQSFESAYAARPLINTQTGGPYVLVPPANAAPYVASNSTGLVYTSPDFVYRGQCATSDGQPLHFLQRGPDGALQYTTQGHINSSVVQSPPQLLVPVGGIGVQRQMTGPYQPMGSYSPPAGIGYPIQQQQIFTPIPQSRRRSNSSYGYSGNRY